MHSKREVPSARTKALGYLARREHTRPELERKLRGKAYAPDEIRQALDALESESLLSHARFISDYVKSAERKGYGPSRIRWDLKSRRGLDEGEIEKGLSEIEVDWVACARRCCSKKFGAAVPVGADKHREYRDYLFRRGFPGDIIRVALAGD